VKLSQSFLVAFRDEIQKIWGTKITTQRDCIDLAAAILLKTNSKVGSHTLRRLFGIVEWNGEFRKTTLDALARYAGESSSNDLIRRIQDQENLVEILVKLQVEKVDIDEYFIKQSLDEGVTMEDVMMAAHMILIRLEQGDHDRVIRMLQTLKKLDEKRTHYYSISAVFAHYVAPKFHQVKDESFINRLITETPYLNLVLSFYAPIMDLDGDFGRHVRKMVDLSNEDEHQAYGHSLLASHALTEGDHITAKQHLHSINRDRDYFSILQGRIDVLFYLTNKNTSSIVSHCRPSPGEEIFYFKAGIPMLVLLEKEDEVQELFEHFDFFSDSSLHWLQQSAQNQIHIAQAWLFARQNQVEKARAIIEQYESTIWPSDYKPISDKMIQLTRSEMNEL